MADELVLFDNKNIKASRDGLRIVGALTEEEWKRAWQSVLDEERKVSYTAQFFLADLAAYASSPVTGWGKSKYDELCDWTGYDNGTLWDLAWMSNRFGIGFRENVSCRQDAFNLSFSHFHEVASITDNDVAYQFLLRAIEGRWSKARLREEVRKYKHPEVKEAQTMLICPKYTREELEYVYSLLEGDETPCAATAFEKTSSALGIIEME